MGSNQKVYFNGIKGHLINYLRNSKLSVLVAVAWLTDKFIIDELVTAKRRGVIIEIIVFKDKINRVTLYNDLFALGAKVYLSKKMMHNKFCIIDGNTIINGSFNWTINANSNRENIQVTTNNAYLTNQFLEEFQSLKVSSQDFKTHFKQEEFNYLDYYEKFHSYYTIKKVRSDLELPYVINQNIDVLNCWNKKIKKGLYLIRNREEELSYFQYLYCFSNDILIQKVKIYSETSFVLPKHFTRLLNRDFFKNDKIRLNTSNIFETDNQVNPDFSRLYTEKLDEQGNTIGEAIEYQIKLSNGYYYSNFLYNGQRLYDINLNKVKLEFKRDNVQSDLVDGVGFFTYESNVKMYGFSDLKGKIKLDREFSNYKIDYEGNLINFYEYPLFKIVNKNVFVFDEKKFDKEKTPRKNHTYCLKSEKLISEFIENSVNEEIKYIFASSNKGELRIFYSELNSRFRKFDEIIESISYDRIDSIRVSYNLIISYNSSTEQKRDAAKKVFEVMTDIDKKFDTKKNNNACYIATMVYGNINHPKVQILRDYRDDKLCKNLIGRLFIGIYYLISPSCVEFLKHRKYPKSLIKNIIDFIVHKLVENKNAE